MSAPTYDSTVKAARMTATRDAVAAGSIEVLDAGSSVLASAALSASGGTIAGDTWTVTYATGSTTGTAAAGTGTDAASAQIKDSGGTVRISDLSVGVTGSGEAVTMNNINIAENQTVDFTGGTITHAPDPV